MENKEQINSTLLRDMFNTIRTAEIKNVKTQKYDDAKMASRITAYIKRTVEEKDNEI